MAIEAPASNVCVTCEQPATTHCAGCADVDVNGARTLTLYCGKACQNKDWSTHKKACQAAQGHKKLFKAAELIQETFYVVRAEAFDLRITKLGRDQDGKLHIFDKAAKSRGYVERAAAWTEGDIDIKHAVLSFSAGGCAYSHLLYQLGVKALKGYVAKIEELDVRMFNSRLLLRHHANGAATATSQSIHHVICVTLKDHSVWVVDPAGAQHGQHKAVLPFSEYNRDFVAKVLDRRPHGASKRDPEKFVQERHPQSDYFKVTLALIGVLDRVADELAVWESKHVPIETMVRSTNKEYQRLKSVLLDHLTTAACNFVEVYNGKQESPVQPIIVRDTTREDIPEAEKQTIEYERARLWATMSPGMRERFDKELAAGRHFKLL